MYRFKSGEKLLVLKKKYRDGAPIRKETPAESQPAHDVHYEFKTPMPKAPPRKVHKGAAQWEEAAAVEEEEETMSDISKHSARYWNKIAIRGASKLPVFMYDMRGVLFTYKMRGVHIAYHNFK